MASKFVYIIYIKLDFSVSQKKNKEKRFCLYISAPLVYYSMGAGLYFLIEVSIKKKVYIPRFIDTNIISAFVVDFDPLLSTYSPDYQKIK